MPGRISRSSLPNRTASTSKTANKKRKQRDLNAFAIAQHQTTDTTKVRQHRLGVTEDDGPQRKKQRHADDDEDEAENEDEDSTSQRKHGRNGRNHRADDLNIESGSDSEGHEWRLGVVENDDDSDLDSEEAFGESDEERFEGFTFRGSSGNNKQRRKTAPTKVQGEPNLDEDNAMGPEADDDDLGEDAIDLAAMLDESQESSDDDEGSGNAQDAESTTVTKHMKYIIQNPSRQIDYVGQLAGSGDMEVEVEEEEQEDASDVSDASLESSDESRSDSSFSDIESDENDPQKLKQLRNAVSSLAHDWKSKEETNDHENEDSSTAAARMLNALRSMSGLDPALMKSVKKLAPETESTKVKKANQMVKVPLPKRQQDRIDRGVAYEKAKETLNRWIGTVKHNRRAEHLSFPLQDPHAQEAQGTTRLLPDPASKPRTELESTIQDIMLASGLAVNNTNSEEDQIKGFEELQSNKLRPEEVLARRAELRKARDLLFREEVRAKRIKKIKSKSYRRVHRKEAQREAQKEKNLLAAAGLDLSEDEKEDADRRRAEERMGARHRESKWGKSIKQTGRAVWDEDARDGVADMARRNEELRKRVEGKRVRNDDGSSSDDLEDSEEELSEQSDDDEDGFRLRQQLDRVKAPTHIESSQSKLSALKFMQRAETARKSQNDADAERLRRDLAGEDSPSESESKVETNLGRKIFGPTEDKSPKVSRPAPNEFEEAESSASEEVENAIVTEPTAWESKPRGGIGTTYNQAAPQSRKEGLKSSLARAKAFVQQPASETAAVGDDRRQSVDLPLALQTADRSAPSITTGWTTVQYLKTGTPSDHGSASDGERADDPLIPSNLELVQSAFGGEDVEAAFAAEKDDAAISEDEKTVDNALPGWGSWAGEGVSKREMKRAAQRTNGRFVSSVADGVKPTDRKDKKLKDVIISERRVKKNAKYLAEKLPHPFESRQQYERSLRLPIGPEWTTKETFQSATKPRILLKAGKVIAPMQQPMI